MDDKKAIIETPKLFFFGRPVGRFITRCDILRRGQMMNIEFCVSDVIPASPEAVFIAWLDSDEHSLMTGGLAKVSTRVGDTFEAWDGYIQGKNLELEPSRRILQSWRTSEFGESDPDSLLEITLAAEGEGTRLTIRHTRLPKDGMQYQQGWVDAYFTPMKDYFGKKRSKLSG